MVKCLPEYKYFTIHLKNRKFISKIRRSKVTEYAALMKLFTHNERLTPDDERSQYLTMRLIISPIITPGTLMGCNGPKIYCLRKLSCCSSK